MTRLNHCRNGLPAFALIGILVPATVGAAPNSTNLRVAVILKVGDSDPVPASDAVVWLAGQHGPTRRRTRIVQRERRFHPRISAVSVGDAVRFPNLDDIDHNVFSLSQSRPFDLGLYRKGQSRTIVFEQPGIVRLFCNIHPSMAAFVVIVDSTKFAKTNAAGIARIVDLKLGQRQVRVWHDMGGEWEGTVTLRGGRTTQLEVVLDAQDWQPRPHLNKYGEDYRIDDATIY